MPTVNDDTKHSEVVAALLLAINQGLMNGTNDWSATTPSSAPNGPGASANVWFSVIRAAQQTLRDLGYTIAQATLAQATTLIGKPISDTNAMLLKKVTANRDFINI